MGTVRNELRRREDAYSDSWIGASSLRTFVFLISEAINHGAKNSHCSIESDQLQFFFD